MHRLLRFARLSSLSAGLMLTTSLMASGPVRAAGAFHRTLSLQGVTFHVQATGAGSQQQLTITTSAGKRALKPIHQTVDGQVMDAEVADLNGNGQPELFVYVQSAGSGSYGEVVAYAVIKGDALSPIVLQELSGAPAKGYMGHDDFRVVEGCLVRRFPIYKPGDTNAKPTGGERQICYKLFNGEASWILRPTSVLQF
ncbi:PliI family lysozyme inhibitor of I-type lysozyme [Synechococcus sp. CBW1107]|jgi:hypothetical protein|uniref:PliI family lysozyme inhibitor of I-type lysozyme n=1 Tax=Synechococcus sp. CBW1107 TaxID=2789857 RepID=UPI002AD5459F|nr:PliI family lysozyme inhibitor of I-type lysozyme [Synechococcus sp. CBW1107]CAK6689859.1 hypothetical protein MNNICLKF_00704 [Synechococcus sp. CBW1107]